MEGGGLRGILALSGKDRSEVIYLDEFNIIFFPRKLQSGCNKNVFEGKEHLRNKLVLVRCGLGVALGYELVTDPLHLPECPERVSNSGLVGL